MSVDDIRVVTPTLLPPHPRVRCHRWGLELLFLLLLLLQLRLVLT